MFFKDDGQAVLELVFFSYGALVAMCVACYYVNPTAVESSNAVQGAVYLGHGWFVPPHLNASKGLIK